ncbi:hypothetical protein CF386_12060 [Paraphotobacterium marinum]|uniref:Uncharacterized protein n=1 Tax=Paraphotobacterium marinum TaxID=1755811 RepID=A0A220VHP0_9GAMM|nr:hypothetical protein [Paraphotobacterium marinum]ASK79770.1 hypothetical protein CF386_12060 [Paraphotobacterium marinum]
MLFVLEVIAKKITIIMPHLNEHHFVISLAKLSAQDSQYYHVDFATIMLIILLKVRGYSLKQAKS